MSSTEEIRLIAPPADDDYAAWRSAADQAADALAAWVASPGPMRGASFRDYRRALDREEDRALALEQARRSARLRRWLR